jgi:hypothetical protein
LISKVERIETDEIQDLRREIEQISTKDSSEIKELKALIQSQNVRINKQQKLID